MTRRGLGLRVFVASHTILELDHSLAAAATAVAELVRERPLPLHTPQAPSKTMSLTDVPPSLELSDIMHHMSPSPVPPEDPGSTTAATTIQQGDIAEERAASPTGPSETDVLGFRRRLEEMGLWSSKRHNGLQENAMSDSNFSSTSSRERELLEMVGVETS